VAAVDCDPRRLIEAHRVLRSERVDLPPDWCAASEQEVHPYALIHMSTRPRYRHAARASLVGASGTTNSASGARAMSSIIALRISSFGWCDDHSDRLLAISRAARAGGGVATLAASSLRAVGNYLAAAARLRRAPRMLQGLRRRALGEPAARPATFLGLSRQSAARQQLRSRPRALPR
jgi:hypothetical protein